MTLPILEPRSGSGDTYAFGIEGIAILPPFAFGPTAHLPRGLPNPLGFRDEKADFVMI
jgi:hypothetical protein